MRRLGLLLSTALVMGCNSILDIPERSLLVEEDSTAGDTALTIDTATPPDTNVVVEDSSIATDTGSGDSTGVDSMMVDSTTTDDSTLADSAMVDTAMADSAMVDSATSDTAPTDMGTDAPTCGVAGSPCCGAVAATCNTGAACSGGVCSAAAGACVRTSDCPSSVCGGPALCGGKLCFSCGAAPGSGALGSACTDKSQCATGVCDRSRGVCSIACANGITGDADCTALTNGKCVLSNWTITPSGGGAPVTGKIGFCARGCLRDGDCAMTEYCRVFGNDVADRVDFVCAPARMGATVDPFGACTTDAECKGGVCVGTTAGGRCSPMCVTDADCGGSITKCTTVTFSRPVSMTNQPAKLCQAP